MGVSGKQQSNDRTAGPSIRRAARLSAVQAIFQLDATSAPVERIVTEFVKHRLPETPDPIGGNPAAVDFFSELVRGVAEGREELDAMLEGVLAEGWSVERLDRVLHSILRCGAYEIAMRDDIPPRVAISEYVDIAGAFFDAKEPGFVNGALDRLARSRRANEMKARPGDRPARSG